MAQPFQCLCGRPSCRGLISGAKNMTQIQLEGVWLNGHIRELLNEQNGVSTVESSLAKARNAYNTNPPSKWLSNNSHMSENGHDGEMDDPTAQALRDALKHAEKVVEAARMALRTYVESTHGSSNATPSNSIYDLNEAASVMHKNELATLLGTVNGSERRGPTSRELSGEMGGDTTQA
jgi:hypothetical protein